MSNETRQIHNAETGEVIIEELTDEEQAELLAERQAAREARAEREAAKISSIAKKDEVLAKLGLTVEDLTALGL
jgi:hypothetical protein